MKRNKVCYIAIVLSLMVLSCKTTVVPATVNNSFYIRKSNDYNSKEIYDSNNKLIYILNKSDARIDWKIKIVKNYLLYLSAKDELVVMDLAEKEKVLVIEDVGDYAVSDDLKYICLGRKLKGSKYTTTPALYDFSKKKFISLKKMDYSFLESKIGISTDIRFNSDDNGFFVNYQWDYSDPDYIFYISLNKFELSRIK